MTTTDTTIRYARDRLGGIDWAFLPKSIFALARFANSGRVYLVANATTPRHNVAGSFIPVDNPKYEHAPTYAAFKRLVVAFERDSTS